MPKKYNKKKEYIKSYTFKKSSKKSRRPFRKSQKNSKKKVGRPKKNSKKKKFKKKMKGGKRTKQATLELINTLYKSLISEIATPYEGIDETHYIFLEVPQGNIYKYDGKNVINLKTNEVIKRGENIILYIMGMGPCGGLIIIKENSILMGHLDETVSSDIITKSLSQDKDIKDIYYIMGMISFDCTLNETCALCDISTEVMDIIEKNVKNLYTRVNIVKDFADYSLTSKLGYILDSEALIRFPIRPEINNEFITKQEYLNREIANLSHQTQQRQQQQLQ